MAFPTADADFAIWLNNFASVLSQNTDALRVTEAEMTSVQRDAAMLNYLVGDLVPAFKSAAQARVAYKDLIKNGPASTTLVSIPEVPNFGAPPPLVPPGVLPRLRALIQRLKNSPGYNEALGRDLGVAGAEDGGVTVTDEAKPTAKATALPNSQVRIDFVKGGFVGVQIEGRRAGEAAWAVLGIDHYSPYLDTRPPLAAGQPELREYRLRYLGRDELVGLYSDIVSTSTTP